MCSSRLVSRSALSHELLMSSAALLLKPGREKSLLRYHPWVFSGAVAFLQGNPVAGETVELRDSSGRFLARAAYSPDSQIRARVWTWDEAEQVDEAFFRSRLEQAFSARQDLSNFPPNDALRLVHAESDRLPGFILDRYADTLVAQFLSAGAERWRELLAELAMQITGATSLYERSDVEARRLEGMSDRCGTLRGAPPPEQLLVQENDLRFQVDVYRGHKTGFYLDQRENRQRVRSLSKDREVLDCFCYSGGFTLNALVGGATTILALDSSGPALAQLRENLALNNLPVERVEIQEGDVFQTLRGFRDRRRTFDMIILDPPKFAQTAAQAQRAARGYKDINLLAFKLLRPGGLLVTFSCSGGVDEALFQKIVAGAALDAGVHAQIIERLGQAADHPIALSFPEGAYLKGLVLRVTA
jgi:23S rRNA (cytosine1962-C5)-methyltransferase